MALEDRLSGLQLRGILAIIVRATERILSLAEKASGASATCHEAIALTSYFAAEEPGPVLWRRKTVAAAEALRSVNGDIFAIDAVRWTARAGEKAYQAATANSHALSLEALECAKQAISFAEKVLGRKTLEVPFDRDLASVQSTHAGQPVQFGPPIDPSPRGPLGFLWAPGEEPEWLLASREVRSGRRRPRLHPVRGVVSLDDIRTEPPDFLCFYVRSNSDAGSLEVITKSIRAISDNPEQIKPRPGFVVYADELEVRTQLELISCGAIVLTGTIAGQTPSSVAEFTEVLGWWLSDTLLAATGDGDQEETTAINIGEAANKSPQANPEEVNARYRPLLDQLSPSLHQLAI